MPDDNPNIRKDASEKSRTAWGARIEEALGGRSKAWLAREAGLTASTLNDIISRTKMEAGNAIRIAQVLDVPVEWLVTGDEVRRAPQLVAADEADWVIVPHYRLGDFRDDGKPDPVDTVPLRRDWLNRNARTSTNLWLTELPATALEGIGEEGDTILCRDASHKNEEGVYLFFWDGVPVVRKFVAPKLGQVGEPPQPGWTWEPEDPPGMRIVARILGTIKLRPV